MSRTLEDKRAMVTALKEDLSESQLALVIDYQGLTVAEIMDFVTALLCGTVCQVAKNTLMELPLRVRDNWLPMTELLKGSSAFC